MAMSSANRSASTGSSMRLAALDIRGAPQKKRPSMTVIRRVHRGGIVAVAILLVLTLALWFASWYQTNQDLRAEVAARQRTDVVASVLTMKVAALTDQLRDAGIKPVAVFTFLIGGTTYVCVAKQGTSSSYDCKGT